MFLVPPPRVISRGALPPACYQKKKKTQTTGHTEKRGFLGFYWVSSPPKIDPPPFSPGGHPVGGPSKKILSQKTETTPWGPTHTAHIIHTGENSPLPLHEALGVTGPATHIPDDGPRTRKKKAPRVLFFSPLCPGDRKRARGKKTWGVALGGFQARRARPPPPLPNPGPPPPWKKKKRVPRNQTRGSILCGVQTLHPAFSPTPLGTPPKLQKKRRIK